MIAEDLGRLFEVGFNLGILAYIEQHQIPHHFGDLYRHDLQKLELPKMLKRIKSDRNQGELISDRNLKIVEQWMQYLLQKGFLGGLNFFREYLKATGWSQQRRRKTQNLEILYYQCSFGKDNSLGTYNKEERLHFNQCLSQFGNLANIEGLISRYSGAGNKGEFLQADTLLLLRYKNQYRILCVDLSIFSVKSAADLKPLDDVEVLRRMLMTEIKYVRSKSVFSKLRIDTGESEYIDTEFSKDLRKYLTAFKRQDKESTKLIQAGSYVHSFYGFLQQQQILPDDAEVIFNVVGYSDRNLSTLSLRPENLDILATCAQIYKYEPKNQEIQNSRRQVFQLIKRNAAKSFIDGKQLMEELATKPLEARQNSITTITHTEKLDDFFNSVGVVDDELATQLNVTPGKKLRDAHAELIEQALLSDHTYVFLTGNPGIGKTTAIANFLQDHLDEGCLFLYVSPRKQVNLDLIEKFKDGQTGKQTGKQTGNLCDRRLFAINSNSAIIKENRGRPTVQYYSDLRQDNFTSKRVDFINATATEAADHNSEIDNYRRRLQQIAEDQIRDRGEKTAGVLSSLCEGIHNIIHEQISNQIIATVSIQSLRVTPPRENGKQNFTSVNTLRHLDNIFKGAYNSRDNRVIPGKMREISQRIKHIFIMIDEITGDDSGVNFLKGISKFLTRFKLSEHGFNAKIIVADASIVEQEVITQHLSQTTPEPDKIYFRMAKQTAAPLSVQQFQFKKRDAIAINANSYPASCLTITYKLFIECVKFDADAFSQKNNQLGKTVQSQIYADIQRLLDDANPPSQLLVYIQDKKRLQELIEKIRLSRGEFTQDTDYLEIHANLSEADKQKISQYKQDVKVVFMTSSASRGLSFPKATHILVEIPQFQIERNLMEVIQVIYRARGEYFESGHKQTLDDQEKQLVFYLSETAVYYADSHSQTDNNCHSREGGHPLKTGKNCDDQTDNNCHSREGGNLLKTGNSRPLETLHYPNSEETSPEHESQKLSIQESILNLLNILIILKLSIMTRITGSGQLGRKKVMMIPIGGKSVSAAGATFTSQMTNLIREIKNEYRRKPSHRILEDVYHSLQEILGRAEFVLHHDEDIVSPVTDQIISYLKLRENFNSQFAKFCQRFDNFLDMGNIEPGILTGNLLVVPIHQTLEETYEIRLEAQIRKYATEDLVKKMWSISKNHQYPDNLRSAMRGGAMELVNLLRGDIDKTQWFELSSQNSDQYYALPLFVLISGATLAEYFQGFKGQPEEEPEREFRRLLSRYVHSLYPAYNTLPIGRQYREFPFLIFRSYSLEEMRVNLFSEQYLLNSHELNVLSLILAKKEG
jgi:hypothetical protein